MSILNAIAQGTNPGAGMVQGRKNQLAMEDRERSYNMARSDRDRAAKNDAFNRQWKMEERDYRRKQDTLNNKAKSRADAAAWVNQIKEDVKEGVLPPEHIPGYVEWRFEAGREMGLDLPEVVPPKALEGFVQIAQNAVKPEKPELMTGVDDEGNPVIVPKVEGARPYTEPKDQMTTRQKDALFAAGGDEGKAAEILRESLTKPQVQIGEKLTPAQKKVDEVFAKDYVEFFASGGIADVEKNLSQLQEVKSVLEDSDYITGPLIGLIPKGMRQRMFPKSVEAQESVEEVVQRNLRLVLGAQFTEKEGTRLIERAYNPSLDESVNAKRLSRLISQIGNAAQAKIEAAKYFEENGTLKGFKGKTKWGVRDFENAIKTPEKPPQNADIEALVNKYAD